MSEKFKFNSSFRGYDRKQVDEYVNSLMFRYDELKTRYEEILRQKKDSDSERDKIAKIFVKAQEKADSIIGEAEREAAQKKKKIEDEINAGRASLERVKNELASFRNRILGLLGNFEDGANKGTGAPGSDYEKIDGDFKINDDFEAI